MPGQRRHVELSSTALVPKAQGAARTARWLFLGLVTFTLAALLAPWQQNVSGTGRVIAYAPSERRQPIEAPVSGRVVHWWVQEGRR